jgi:hypothetical protein
VMLETAVMVSSPSPVRDLVIDGQDVESREAGYLCQSMMEQVGIIRTALDPSGMQDASAR